MVSTLHKNQTEVTSLEAPPPAVLDYINYILYGENTETHVASLARDLSYFPAEYLEQYRAAGGTFLITDEDQTEYVSVRYCVRGCYLSKKKKIVIFTEGKQDSAFYSITGIVSHEFCHYIWREIVNDADKATVEASFRSDDVNKTAAALNDSYCKTNIGDYWAELASAYVCDYKNNDIQSANLSDSILSVLEKYFPHSPTCLTGARLPKISELQHI